MNEIENVPVPPEAAKPKRATRARTTKKKETEATKAHASLLAALKFIGPAQRKAGTVQECFASLQGGWLTASDGVLMIATPLADELEICPHTHQLTHALSKCVETFALAQVSEGALAVVSGNFRALVECVPMGALQFVSPDPQCAVIDNKVKAAIGCVSKLATEGAQLPLHAAVLLQAWTAVATNGFLLLEAAHGTDLPPGLMIPRRSADAIAACAKDLTGFGFSQSSATFYCADGSFIKTQLFQAGQYPHYQSLFENPGSPQPLPADFFNAVEHASLFGDNVMFAEDRAQSISGRAETYYKFPVPPQAIGLGFSAKQIKLVRDCMHTAEFQQEFNRCVFYGGANVRGAIMGLNLSSLKDDDIPF